MEIALGAVAYVESEAPDHFHHSRGRLERLNLVVDVGVGAEEAEVAHHSRRVAQGAASSRLLLDQQRGVAGVDRGRAEDVDHGDAESQRERNREPPPFAEAEEEEFLEAEGVSGALGLLEEEIRIVVSHSFSLLWRPAGKARPDCVRVRL